MKRGSKLVLIGLAGVLAAASTANAQYVFLGGGASLPMSDFKEFAKMGWIAQGGVGVDVGDKGLWVEAEAWYGSNKHKAPDDADKTNLLAVMGGVGYSFTPDKKLSPYVVGSAGMLQHKYVPGTGTSESEWNFAWAAGAGFGYKLSPKATFWVEGRFMDGGGEGSNFFIPITAGVTINFGKSGGM